MKKIFIALALILAVQVADAQTKSPAAAKKAVESAKAATAKAEAAAAAKGKPVKVTVYLAEAKAYMDAYNSPAGPVWVGMGLQEYQLLVTEKPTAIETIEIQGNPYQKYVFPNKNFYFNANGILSLIEVTSPVVDNALENALNAYKKAYAVDTKAAKLKDVTAGIQTVSSKYMDDAITQYTLGDLAASSVLFEAAANAAATEPVAEFDSTAVYNAGFTALYSGNDAKAKENFEKCYANGFYYDEGDVFSKLADLYKKDGDTTKSVETLKEGFAKFPESQAILVGLINYYIESGKDQDELFVLIDKAKQNEPNNPSLYYVEGNIYSQLGREEEAIAAYRKSYEVNNEYENGLIGIGILYYNKAIKISEEASMEFNDAKYMALVEKFEEAFMAAIEPFETAYAVSKVDDIKINLIAESLKNIYYRFQDKGEQYKAGYEKYNKVVKDGVAY